MLIAWTTVASADEANALAREAIEHSLAVCVQIEGPIVSYYRWEGRLEQSSEYRLCFKFMPGQTSPLQAWLHQRHSYTTPEWVVVEAKEIGEKYLSWAMASSTSPPFHL